MEEPSELDLHRQKTSFDVKRLAAMLEPEGRQQMKADILTLMMKEPAFDKGKRSYLSRPQALAAGIKATRCLIQLRREHRWTEQLETAMELFGDTTSLALHELAFRPVIASQGSDEQQAYWSPRAAEYAIFGCYAQTELGHGSNVQKLETTATYDPTSEQFDLHSPTLTSTKWWMGGLGVMASHCVVQAQLLVPVDGRVKSYGPHLFIMRIRDEKNHLPLPGITIGDIGPKAHGAMAGLDNGYIRFSHVSLPRLAMLSRFAQLSPEGVYTMPPHAKLSYGGMIYIRAQMIGALARALARSVIIATRYLHIRRQFGNLPTKREIPVIQYPGVYMRIVPTLVNAYVFMLVGKQMLEDYNAMAAGLKKGDTALLARVHAASSGLKVYASTAVVEGCETCRRACGGHGFMASAGLAAIYALQLPSTTYEGDNYILNQQVCRAAVKTYSGKTSPKGNTPISEHSGFSQQTMESLLDARAMAMVGQLAEKKAEIQEWTDLSWDCVAVAKAVTEANISQHLKKAIDELKSGKVLTSEHQVLINMYQLWQLYIVEAARADLLEYQLVAASFFQRLRSIIDTRTRALLPDLIGLTDGFGFSDWELNSTLGCAGGRPYEELLEKAERDKDLNLGDQEYRTDVHAILGEGRTGYAMLQSKL